MPILNPIKETNLTKINCKDQFKVTIGLTGVPTINENPVDIILILDRSGSMTASKKLENLKIGAKQQVDMITKATGGVIDKLIGGNSKIGLVSFSTDATIDVPLTNDASLIKQQIDALIANGQTNHGAGFTKAVESFDPASTNEKIIIMFTDGAINEGEDPIPITQKAKQDGIKIYCIGVENTAFVIEDWASTPIEDYIAFSKDPADLSNLFIDIGNRITTSGVTNSKIIETVNDNFKIVSIDTPTFGTVSKTSDTTLEWNINNIGNITKEDAKLTFNVKYLGTKGGTFKINKKIEYIDDQKTTIVFPDPEIEVECKVMEEILEPCPIPVEIAMNGCEDSATFNLENNNLESLGRIIQIDTIIKNVCPGKRIAVAVQLMEIDDLGNEHSRGLKFFEIPAHSQETCTDVNIKCIKFVLPETLDTTGDTTSICNIRNFKVYVISNYIDTDFKCCK